MGDFSLDLLAKDLGTGRHVVIENQLTPTDHDHLGKLLTYASAFDAAAIIWVSQTIRDEHRQALEWLNQRTSDDTNFFGVAIEVLKIDDSKPAYNFKPVVFPNEWRKGSTGGPVFDRLVHLRKELEAAFGEPLEWERLDDRRACRVACYFVGSITAPAEELAAIRQGMIDRLLRFKKVFGPVLPKVTQQTGSLG